MNCFTHTSTLTLAAPLDQLHAVIVCTVLTIFGFSLISGLSPPSTIANSIVRSSICAPTLGGDCTRIAAIVAGALAGAPRIGIK